MSAQPPQTGFTHEDRLKVARGIATTLLGKIAEASQGVFLFVARYLYGGMVFGLFVIAFNLVELLSRFLVGGFGDAVTFFGAMHSHPPGEEDEPARLQREEALYRSVATCLVVPLGLSLLAVLVLYAIAGPLYEAVWLGQDRSLLDCIRVLAWVLPLAVLVRLPVEAVKAHLDMKWSVLVADSLLPVLNLAFAVVLFAAGQRGLGLVWAAVLAHLVCIPVAWYGYSRYFAVRRTLRAMASGRLDRTVLGFGIPQSFNMMFNFGLSRVDALMLSGWTSANLVGIYTLVSELARTIRAAKTSFSTVFAPLVAKYKAQRNQAGLVESLNAITRWTTALSIPLLFAIMAFYPDVILGPVSAWPYGPWFPWMASLAPMMSCYFGLAGNLLLMTGHSRLLLLNSTLMMGVNVVLNALFIPGWGLFGAAFATMIASAALSVTQMVEMWVYERIRFATDAFAKTTLSAALAVAPVVLVNTRVGHDVLISLGPAWGLVVKVALVVAALGAYAAGIFLWPGENPERQWLRERLAKRRRRALRG